MQVKKNIVGIIQARLGSKRFPGKMLAQLGDRKVIDWVILRLKNSKKITHLVLATSQEKKDDPLVEHVSKHQISVYRGSEDNVLQRFIDVGNEFQADSIVRICADNPFIDSGEVDKLVDAFNEKEHDYLCNHKEFMGNKYPDGFGAEIFTYESLLSGSKQLCGSDEIEHVTKLFFNELNNFKCAGLSAEEKIAFPQYKFDVDYSSDLLYLNNLVDLGVKINSSAEDVIKIAKEFELN
ncbi:hypothetical protein G6659_01670 [Polynucleobacter paneuropaeus]|nr:hypothetical protein G6659_01670 [Polynucleobacter paneuropaeus]